MKTILDSPMPILSWCEHPQEGAISQAYNLSALPFTFKHVALMPDTHQGFGMPIGGVLATKGVIIPASVGSDIGCGVCAVETSLTDLPTEDRKKILGLIRKAVPVGFAHHQMPQPEMLMPEFNEYNGNGAVNIVANQAGAALRQIGTLGGGNHFIELQQSTVGKIYIMIHSGSRNLGKQVADHYNKIAVELNEKYFSQVPKEWQLAFLPLDSPEGQLYKEEMQYCVEFAKASRALMMARVQDCIINVLPNATFEEEFDVSHNYARMEHHFGKDVLVHRKGATSARQGEIGIVPGSQGTSSYIVRGKGNRDSFESCSHGAGRKMGRKEAQRTLNLEEEKAKLEKKGIVHSVRNAEDLDEAPGSYKDIDVVMAEQADLVDIVVKLEPLGVVKG
jgi:tRNA-splicing ligase RtcB